MPFVESHVRSGGDGGDLELLVVGEEDLTTFVADALAFEAVQIRVATRDEVVKLLEANQPLPSLLIVDFEKSPPIDQLRMLRERGWRGPLFAIGNVSSELQHALSVSCVLASKLTSKELKRVVRSTLEAASRETLR